jgi:S1-C subfamily serine protease
LGYVYAKGIGVPKNAQQAYFWFLLSSANGSDVAIKNRDIIEGDLTPNERAIAQTAARDWKPNNNLLKTNEGSELNQGVSSGKLKTTGSAFFVAGNMAITNFHVIDGCSRLVLKGNGDATVAATDRQNDFAVLKSRTSSEAVAVFRDGRLRAGESVTVVGFPLSNVLGSGASVTGGNVSALAGPSNDARLIQITAPVQSGNSGGPLLDVGGNVVGIVVSKLDALKIAKITGEITQNVNFALKGALLQAFLDSNGIEYKTSSSGRKLSSTEVAERGQRFTVLVECYE